MLSIIDASLAASELRSKRTQSFECLRDCKEHAQVIAKWLIGSPCIHEKIQYSSAAETLLVCVQL